MGILTGVAVVIVVGVFVLGQDAVIVVIIIQIVGNTITVGIIIGRVAVLRNSMRQGHILVNRQNTVAIVIGIQVIGQTAAIGILGVFGIMVSVRVGIFGRSGYMVVIVIGILEIINAVSIRIAHRIIQGSAIGRCFQNIHQTVGSHGIVQVTVQVGIASDRCARFGKIKKSVAIAIQVDKIGHTVAIGIKAGFDLAVGISYAVVIVIIIQINRNTIVVGIGLRVNTMGFDKVGNTVIIIVNIGLIGNAVAIEIGHRTHSNILSNNQLAK